MESYNKVYKNDEAITFNLHNIYYIANKEYPDIPHEEIEIIVSDISYLIEDLDISNWGCFYTNISPEEYIFKAVLSYLKNNHTLKDLDNINNINEILKYAENSYKKFIPIGDLKFNELKVIENITKKEYTLTQFHSIFKEDYYNIYRTIACEIIDNNLVHEKDFYVYKISYMENSDLTTIYVDEDTTLNLINNNIISFLHGTANNIISNFFRKK